MLGRRASRASIYWWSHMSKVLIYLCIINSVLLILHEIESAYEKEWIILKIPVDITGFILLHIPILILLFYCPIAILLGHGIGYTLSIIIGFGGTIPFLVHKVFFNNKEHFNKQISYSIIYLDLVIGIIEIITSIYMVINK